MRKQIATLCAALVCSASASAQRSTTPVRPVPPPAMHIERAMPEETPSHSSAWKMGNGFVGKSPTATLYSHGDPTPEEQYILELINWSRANPKAEGDTLFATKDPDITSAYNYWGTPTRSQVRSDFATYPAQPPLAFNADLITAARRHTQDMIDHNFQSHTGSDNSTFDQRINDAGYTGWTAAGENIYAYGTSMFDIHSSFEIDFGNANLGHRQNIMNFTGDVFTEIGVGLKHGGTGLPNVGPIVTTEDFGKKSTHFILGVVYDDKNHNGFYDIGEGLAGVTVKASGGTYYAVTSTSGGYAIPFSGSGTIAITATGTGLPGTQSKNVSFNGQNVKVDFTPQSTGAPGAVTLITPQDTTVRIESTKLTWAKVTGATKYWVQFGMDTVVANMIVSDSTLTDTTRLVNLVDGVTYYWRASAKNTKGWGTWSDFASFTVAVTAKKVTLISPATNEPVDNAKLVWNSSAPNVTTYRVQVYPNGSLTSAIVDDSTITDTSYNVVASLAQNATYYWRVTAKNSNGWGAASDVRTFKYIGLGVINFDAASFTVTTTSVDRGLRFEMSGVSDATPKLEIFNVAGVEVLSEAIPGPSFTWIDARPGVYLYRVTDGANTATGRVVVP